MSISLRLYHDGLAFFRTDFSSDDPNPFDPSRRLLPSWLPRAPDATVNVRDPKGVAIETSLGWLTANSLAGSVFLDFDSVVSVAEHADLAFHTPSPAFGETTAESLSCMVISSGNQTRSHVGMWRPAARQRQRVGDGLTSPRWVRPGRHAPLDRQLDTGTRPLWYGCRVDGGGHRERSAAP
jgi:hypothetical protein